jgi:protein ImuA
MKNALPHRSLSLRKMPSRLGFGVPCIDALLHGGLAQGSLHEFYAAAAMDAPAMTGLGLALAARAAGQKRVVWIRQDMLTVETGAPYAAGLTSLGLDHRQFIIVKAKDSLSALKAALEGARCGGLSSLVVDVWGDHRLFDLTNSRRLFLAAKQSGATLLMLRASATPSPSAAETRWRVKAAASKAWVANAPGYPRFDLALLRNRTSSSFSDNSWCVEWNSDTRTFAIADRAAGPALPRAVVSIPVNRQVDADEQAFRRTG